MRGRDVIITGVPRSGTTLACHLLNKLPETVALHEPLPVGVLGKLENRGAMIEGVARFFQDTRQSLLERGEAISYQVEGRIPDNPAGEAFDENGRRKIVTTRAVVKITKPLGLDFTLCLKHPAFFTALLGELNAAFHCVAIVRNPLSVLASWSSVDFKEAEGRAPAAEAVDTALARELDGTADAMDRQFRLLAWFHGKYRACLTGDCIVKYEEIIATGGRCLRVVTPAAEALAEALVSRNKNPAYKPEQVELIRRRLADAPDGVFMFYSRQEVLEGKV